MATIVTYSPVLEKFVTVSNAAPRSAMAYALQMPAEFIGDSVHCYISSLPKNHREAVIFMGFVVFK